MSQINLQLPTRLLSESEILLPARSLLGDRDRGLTAFGLGTMKSSLKQCSTASGFLLPPSSACLLGQMQPALGRALACNESQVRELFSKSRDQKEFGFVLVVFPGMTEDPAAVAHPASSPTLADALAVIGVRLSLTEPGDTATRGESGY